MGTYPFRQTNFSGGYLSPELLGRTDTAKYQTGLAEFRNMIVARTSGAQNRSGSLYCGGTKNPTVAYRAVPFVLSNAIAYHLEFGNLYIRPWRNGARVSVVGAAAYAGGTTYGQGDLVTDVGVVYRSLVSGNIGNTPLISPGQWMPQVGGLLEITTVIAQGALSTLQFVQQNDVMTLVDHSFYPQTLSRFSDVKWTIANFTQSNGINPPTGVAAVAGVPAGAYPGQVTGLTAIGGNGAGTKDHYVVTAWQTTAPVSEGQVSGEAIATVGKADAANPVALAWTVVAGATGYAIYKQLGPGVGNPYEIIGISNSNAFSDNGILAATPIKTASLNTLSSNATTYTYGITAVSADNGAESLISASASCSGQTPTSTAPNVITWVAPVGFSVSSYKVYRNVGGVYTFIGETPALTFNDTNISPSGSQPPVSIPLFTTTNDYPSVVGYFQQRLLLGNTLNQPQTVWCSRVGVSTSFTVSTPIADNDAMQFVISNKQVQPIQAFVDLGKLIIHTSNGEYVCLGNSAGTLTPSSPNCVLQGGCGSQAVAPVVIGNTDIFIQALGNLIRDLRYDIQSVQYTGKDVSIYTPDLLNGRTVVAMAWQQVKNSIVWMVLSDGALLSLTYIREENVWAWSTHDTGAGDLITQVIVLPEGTQEVVYLGVMRYVSGAYTMCIEKLANRDFLDRTYLTDAYFPDSAQLYDGRNTGGTTLTLTTAGGWTSADIFTLTASAGIFALTDAAAGNPQGVANEFILRQVSSAGIDTARLYFTVTQWLSPTQVRVTTNAAVPTWARVALTTWGKAIHAFTGIGHLEGRELSVLGDGDVVASPFNPLFDDDTITVVAGAFTTPDNVNLMVVCAGLPVMSQMTTLPLENQKGDTILAKQKAVKELTVTMCASRGGLYGQLAGGNGTTTLKPWKQRQDELLASPTSLFSGSIRINSIASNWGPKGAGTGQVVIQQPDPLPLGISGVTVLAEIGD